MRCDVCRRERTSEQIDHLGASGINTCKDYADCCLYRSSGQYMNAAQEIIDLIIKSNLLHATCVENEDHGCLVVWSSGAQGQLAAYLQENMK